MLTTEYRWKTSHFVCQISIEEQDLEKQGPWPRLQQRACFRPLHVGLKYESRRELSNLISNMRVSASQRSPTSKRNRKSNRAGSWETLKWWSQRLRTFVCWINCFSNSMALTNKLFFPIALGWFLGLCVHMGPCWVRVGNSSATPRKDEFYLFCLACRDKYLTLGSTHRCWIVSEVHPPDRDVVAKTNAIYVNCNSRFCLFRICIFYLEMASYTQLSFLCELQNQSYPFIISFPIRKLTIWYVNFVFQNVKPSSTPAPQLPRLLIFAPLSVRSHLGSIIPPISWHHVRLSVQKRRIPVHHG